MLLSICQHWQTKIWLVTVNPPPPRWDRVKVDLWSLMKYLCSHIFQHLSSQSGGIARIVNAELYPTEGEIRRHRGEGEGELPDWDRDSTWIWTLTKVPICMTRIFRYAEPFCMNFWKFRNHLHELRLFKDARYIQISSDPYEGNFRWKTPPIWAPRPLSLNNQVPPPLVVGIFTSTDFISQEIQNSEADFNGERIMI